MLPSGSLSTGVVDDAHCLVYRRAVIYSWLSPRISFDCCRKAVEQCILAHLIVRISLRFYGEYIDPDLLVESPCSAILLSPGLHNRGPPPHTAGGDSYLGGMPFQDPREDGLYPLDLLFDVFPRKSLSYLWSLSS